MCLYMCTCLRVQCRKLSDGLFLECCRATAEEHLSIEFDSMIIDNTCMQVGVMLHIFVIVCHHPLTSTWPHLNSDVGLEEGEY